MTISRLLLLIAVPLALAACASSTETTPQQASSNRANSSFQPTTGKAGLYIYKNGAVLTAAQSDQINLDGRMLGLVAQGAYLYKSLPPGIHTLSCGSSQVTLTVVAGQNYYVKQTPNVVDGQLLSSPLTLVSPEEGKPQVQTMQQADLSH